eukprot:UN20975
MYCTSTRFIFMGSKTSMDPFWTRFGTSFSLALLPGFLIWTLRRRTTNLIARVKVLPHVGDLQVSMLGFHSEWVHFMSTHDFVEWSQSMLLEEI